MAKKSKQVFIELCKASTLLTQDRWGHFHPTPNTRIKCGKISVRLEHRVGGRWVNRTPGTLFYSDPNTVEVVGKWIQRHVNATS